MNIQWKSDFECLDGTTQSRPSDGNTAELNCPSSRVYIGLAGDDERRVVVVAGGVTAVVQAMEHFPTDLKVQVLDIAETNPLSGLYFNVVNSWFRTPRASEHTSLTAVIAVHAPT